MQWLLDAFLSSAYNVCDIMNKQILLHNESKIRSVTLFNNGSNNKNSYDIIMNKKPEGPAMHCHLHRGDWSFHLTNEKKKKKKI